MAQFGITVILPTLNEEKNLQILIPELVSVFKDLSLEKYEILIVDDSSEDQTERLIEKLSQKNKKINIFQRKTVRSLPMSILDGIKNSKNDYVMWLDADGSMGHEAVKELLEHQIMNKNSFIVGSRFVLGGGYKGIEETGKTSFFRAMINVSKSNDSVLATILSKIFNNILYSLFPSKVKDLTSGFIVGPKKYINEEVFVKSNYGDYFVYLVDDLYKKNIEIIEVGYLCEMRMHGTSKTGSSIRQLINRGFPYIIAALKCRMSTNENKRQ